MPRATSPAWWIPFALVAGVAVSAYALDRTEAPTPPGALYVGRVPADQRQVFYGDLHLHTAMSFDAWTAGTRLTPEQAYAFGRGEVIRVPASQVQRQQGSQGNAEVPVRRAWPLDFMAVTDHSESIGIFRELENPDSVLSRSEIGRRILTSPGSVIQQMFDPHRPLPPEMRDAAIIGRAWHEVIDAANRAYRPGRFTTFIGYEWTLNPDNANLHRNVVFNSSDAPPIFSSDQSARPDDLWMYLEAVRAGGRDVIAIPHNSNISNGKMFDLFSSDGAAVDATYAIRRRLNEPLVEVAQVKGQSETIPELSPTDEYASFENFENLLGTRIRSNPNGSYVRQALGRGLLIRSRVGINPYKLGFVGGSDIHNGLSTSEEMAFGGGPNGGIDPANLMPAGEAARRSLGLSAEGATANADPSAALLMGSGGLTGVWAEENSRNAIFAALKRRETFATSGTRIRLRMFGGWGLEASLLSRRDWVSRAYRDGVPMGGDMPARPVAAAAPTFAVEAAKDPDGANLQRLQIVKIWLAEEKIEETVFDVAVSDVANSDRTADSASGRRMQGAATLAAVWTDPAFDPAAPAVYYARALEVPTPRWSTFISRSVALPVPPNAAGTIQERAWSSPIWYSLGSQN